MFVWAEKEIMQDLIHVLEDKYKFYYVENVTWIMLDERKRKEVENSKRIDISPAFYKEDGQFLKKAHKTLLMFRKGQDDPKAERLELRHQRTSDALCEFVDFSNIHKKPQFFVYALIEILLPRAKKEPSKPFKMVEFWAQDDQPRANWLKIHVERP